MLDEIYPIFDPTLIKCRQPILQGQALRDRGGRRQLLRRRSRRLLGPAPRRGRQRHRSERRPALKDQVGLIQKYPLKVTPVAVTHYKSIWLH